MTDILTVSLLHYIFLSCMWWCSK